jgi:predicted nucleic acid-binding protein
VTEYPDRLVLDTDVASGFFKKRHASGRAGPDPRWCVTFVTVGELWRWAAEHDWGNRAQRDLTEWLGRVSVLPYSEEVARIWGRISGAARRRGRPRPQNDTWIAACCLADGLPLITGNLKDHVDFAAHEGLQLVHR